MLRTRTVARRMLLGERAAGKADDVEVGEVGVARQQLLEEHAGERGQGVGQRDGKNDVQEVQPADAQKDAEERQGGKQRRR